MGGSYSSSKKKNKELLRELQGEMEKQRRGYERRVLEEEVTGEVGRERRRKDETAERWKKLYNVIKAELDDLILRTHNSGDSFVHCSSVVQDLQRQVRGKEKMIEALKTKVIAMEKEGLKKAREVDILRQSLRIIMNSKAAR